MSAVPFREPAPLPSCGRWLLALRRARRRQTPPEHRGSLIRLATSQVVLLLLLLVVHSSPFFSLSPGVNLPRSSSHFRGDLLNNASIELASDRLLIEGTGGGRWEVPLDVSYSCLGYTRRLPGASMKRDDLLASPLGMALQELRAESQERLVTCTKCGRRYGCPCPGEPEQDVVFVADGLTQNYLLLQIVKTAHALNMNVRLLVEQGE